ncbi:MAG: hypothetical protein MZV63_19395 [Marinilabiliales bacterium]|nr:hypothetical protein [Marinilabiliales bacterium]
MNRRLGTTAVSSAGRTVRRAAATGADLPGGGAGQHRHAGYAGFRGGASGAWKGRWSPMAGVSRRWPLPATCWPRVICCGRISGFSWPAIPRVSSRPLTDLRNRELIMAGLLCLVMIGVGLYADPWIKMIGGAVENVARVFEAGADISHSLSPAELV